MRSNVVWGRFQRPLDTPVMDCSVRLRDPELVHSLPFRREAMGVHLYEGMSADLLIFKRAFEARLWSDGYPVVCEVVGPTALRYEHFLRDLTDAEQALLRVLGQEVARQVEVPIRWIEGFWSVPVPPAT